MFIGLKSIGVLTNIARELPAVRLDSTVYNEGDTRTFGGYTHRCVIAGTSGVGVPAIITPIGAPELITNGMFDADTSGWSPVRGGVITHETDRLRITNGAVLPSSVAEQQITVSTANSYMLTVNLKAKNVANAFLRVSQLTETTGTLYVTDTLSALGVSKRIFSSAVTTPFVALQVYLGISGDYSEWDDISVKQVTEDGTAAWETLGYA